MAQKNGITLDPRTLSKVIESKVGISGGPAKDLALRLLNYFGFGMSVIDNCLDQEDRRLFYFLQDLKILKTHWEEAILPSGRTWRIFYWDLNLDEIVRELTRLSEGGKEEASPYESLPDEIWSRDRSAEIA